MYLSFRRYEQNEQRLQEKVKQKRQKTQELVLELSMASIASQFLEKKIAELEHRISIMKAECSEFKSKAKNR
jgi:hypothetical protein